MSRPTSPTTPAGEVAPPAAAWADLAREIDETLAAAVEGLIELRGQAPEVAYSAIEGALERLNQARRAAEQLREQAARTGSTAKE